MSFKWIGLCLNHCPCEPGVHGVVWFAGWCSGGTGDMRQRGSDFGKIWSYLSFQGELFLEHTKPSRTLRFHESPAPSTEVQNWSQPGAISLCPTAAVGCWSPAPHSPVLPGHGRLWTHGLSSRTCLSSVGLISNGWSQLPSQGLVWICWLALQPYHSPSQPHQPLSLPNKNCLRDLTIWLEILCFQVLYVQEENNAILPRSDVVQIVQYF